MKLIFKFLLEQFLCLCVMCLGVILFLCFAYTIVWCGMLFGTIVDCEILNSNLSASQKLLSFIAYNIIPLIISSLYISEKYKEWKKGKK